MIENRYRSFLKKILSMSANVSIRLVGLIVFITLLFSFLGWKYLSFLELIQYPLLAILLITIGLPHGATDYLLFRRMNKSKLTNKQIYKFFAIYVATVIGFLILWFAFPLISFIIFILISSYHFGQSNWENIVITPKYSLLLNLFWGAFAIGGSVLWHWHDSKMIIGQVIGFVPDISQNVMDIVQLGLVVVNVLLIVLLNYYNTITSSQSIVELGKIAILASMFYFTPMLIGFALYFTLWHSLSSLMSQLSYYKKLWPSFTLSDYYYQAAPYTLLAILGFVIMVLGHSYILPGVSMISTFLIFIACVTLPHIIVVEESYQH